MRMSLAAALVGLTAAAFGAGTRDCPAGAGFDYDAAASDEFDGAELDATRWDDWVESFQGRRAGFLFARDNVKVADGTLRLTARLLREDEKTVENLRRGFDTYATAIVKAKAKTFYGYYECRAKAMNAAVCNAFWLYDPLSDSPEKKYRPGDFSEEIDIFEIFGKEGSKPSDCLRTCYNTVHRLGTPYLEGRVFGSVEKLPRKGGRTKVDFDFADGYHTYGFLWTEKELKWFADGKETFSRPNDFFHRPMHVTFDCEIMYGWVGEPEKSDLPQTYSVDYFRHWRLVPAPDAPAPAVRAKADFLPATADGKGVQAAIDAAAAAGGGRVVLKPGVYPSATLYFRDGVELHLEKGAVLRGSALWSDYDDVDDPRIGKVPERSKKAFLAAIGCRDIAITGEGTVDGQGLSFYDTNVPPGRMFPKPPHPRTRMVECVACSGVRFDGVEFKDSPGWTFWIRNCEDVVCRGLDIHGDQRMINNDGLHFDGCRRVRVSGCTIRTGDDCIIMRANRMPGGTSLCEDLVVEDCTLDSNCQAIRLGCPSDDTIRDGVFRRLRITGNNGIASIHPARYLQPGCEGYCRMQNLLVEDCEVDVRGAAVLFTVDPGIRLREFGNTRFRNLKLKRSARVVLEGTADSPLVNVDFESAVDTRGHVPFERKPSDSWEAD